MPNSNKIPGVFRLPLKGIPFPKSEKTEKEWRKLLDPLIQKTGAANFEAAFTAAFNAAVNRDLHDAFFLYTDQSEGAVFSDFIVALMLKGDDAFNKVLADPSEIAKLNIPRDVYFLVEGFFGAFADALDAAGVEHNLALDRTEALEEEQLKRIRAIDPEGKGPFPPREPAVESEKAYRFRNQTDVYRAELAKRWPALAPEPRRDDEE
jgi:hypothetical protein